MEYYYALLETVAAGSDSSLIFFFVILAALILPLYGLLLRERRYSRQHDIDTQKQNLAREGLVLDVVRDATAAITECTTVITGAQRAIDRIHDRLFEIPQQRTG